MKLKSHVWDIGPQRGAESVRGVAEKVRIDGTYMSTRLVKYPFILEIYPIKYHQPKCDRISRLYPDFQKDIFPIPYPILLCLAHTISVGIICLIDSYYIYWWHEGRLRPERVCLNPSPHPAQRLLIMHLLQIVMSPCLEFYSGRLF